MGNWGLLGIDSMGADDGAMLDVLLLAEHVVRIGRAVATGPLLV